LKQQKIEELSHDGYGHLLGNIDDVWKKVMPSYTIIM
jgi:ATP-dependent RNA helicase DHX29